MRLAFALLSSVLASACAGTGASESGSAGQPDTAGDDERPAPIFLEPADGDLALPVTRTAPIELGVDFVLPGLTELLIDERNVGTLGAGGALGDLDTTRLRLA